MLALDKSRLNSVSFLILRCSFQRAVSMDFWSLSRLKNTAEGSIKTSCKN